MPFTSTDLEEVSLHFWWPPQKSGQLPLPAPHPQGKANFIYKIHLISSFLISLQSFFFFFALLRALILLSVRSLKTLASNNWGKKWLFKDNCNLLNTPDYHMLTALKLQINDEEEQRLSFRGNWPLSNASSLMSSVCCISLCEFHGVKKKRRRESILRLCTNKKDLLVWHTLKKIDLSKYLP